MPRQVTKASGNVLCQARLRAAKYNDDFATRATAVNHLPGVTEDSLKKYELDIVRAPNIVVALMADAYNAPELRQWYCANECPLGHDCREIPETTPERALLRLTNMLNDINAPLDDFAHILDDGIIDAGERAQIPETRKYIVELRHRLDEMLANLDRIVNSNIGE